MDTLAISNPVLPSYDDVVAAARRIEGHAHKTPVLTSRTANRELGAEVFFKCENYQRMGAFKFRGAFNALSKFDATQRKHGVVAFSSGNHAQGIALSAQLLGIPATIVMPHDAPAAKVAATKEYGATVVVYDRYSEDREAIGRQLAQAQGLTLIPPYDHLTSLPGRHGSQRTVRGGWRAGHAIRLSGRRWIAQWVGAGDARAGTRLQVIRRRA